MLALAARDRRERPVGAVPALVAVHGVVAAARRSRSGRWAARRGRRPAACGETSRPSVNAWIHVFSGAKRSSARRWSMCEWTPPLRDEPEQVHPLAALEGGHERGVLEEGAVLDRLVHPHQVLEEHAAGADRQVADLGVAHLSRRQADRLARGGERRVRVLGPEPVEDGRVGKGRRRCPARAARSPSRRGRRGLREGGLANRGERVGSRGRRRRPARRRRRAGRGARRRSRA